MRLGVKENPDPPIALYDLSVDAAERTGIADEYPDIVAQLMHAMDETHQESRVFPLF